MFKKCIFAFHNILMNMFEFIKKVNSLENLYSISTAYSYRSISNECNFGKEVWIQYYKNETMKNTIFSVGDSINMMGDVATIMLYVENEDESNDKTYNVYRYNGELQIDRRIVENIKHDILLNIDIIIDELRNFLKEENKKGTPF